MPVLSFQKKNARSLRCERLLLRKNFEEQRLKKCGAPAPLRTSAPRVLRVHPCARKSFDLTLRGWAFVWQSLKMNGRVKPAFFRLQGWWVLPLVCAGLTGFANRRCASGRKGRRKLLLTFAISFIRAF